MKAVKKLFKNLIILAFWLFVWHLMARRSGSSLLLPTPAEVFARLFELALTAHFWQVSFASLLRVLCGLVLAILIGCALAVLSCSSRLVKELLSPLLTVVKATPVVSFIVLAIIWIGRDHVPAFIAVLMVVPMVWSNVSAGIEGTDAELLQMARVYAFGPMKTLRRVYIPSVMPHFLAACRGALGLGWKAGVTAEVLTVPAVSIGRMLSDARQYMEIPDLFAWTLVIVICSLFIEKLLMRSIALLDGKGRWRK